MRDKPQVIIIVEDEWLIRLGAADELRNHGFEVLEAGNADEALELLGLHHWAIGVLFTDVHMPGDMNGMELAHHTRRHWPWIGILIASGQARPSETELPAGSRFLPKPYEHAHVVRHVRELVAA